MENEPFDGVIWSSWIRLYMVLRRVPAEVRERRSLGIPKSSTFTLGPKVYKKDLLLEFRSFRAN